MPLYRIDITPRPHHKDIHIISPTQLIFPLTLIATIITWLSKTPATQGPNWPSGHQPLLHFLSSLGWTSIEVLFCLFSTLFLNSMEFFFFLCSCPWFTSLQEVLCRSSYHLNFWAFSRTSMSCFQEINSLSQFPFRLNILEFVIDDYFELWWKQNGLLSAFRTLFSLCNRKLLISCYKTGDKLLPL